MSNKIDLNRSCLAINGGEPVRTKPWIDNFTLGHEEKAAALEAIESGYLSKFEGSFTPDPPFSFLGGPYVQRLESSWCDFYGVKHAVSMNSATSGLFAAWGALQLGYGDEVIVPAITMTACASGPLMYGAIPVFADVDRNTGCIDPDAIEKLISKRTKAILVVHLYGYLADMDRICAICKKYNIALIEDCAQSHIAKYNGRYAGTFGDIGVFSLNVNKTIQVGEGGVCVASDPDIAYRLQLIRNHGEAVVGPAQYDNITNILGFNYRLSEIQASMAISQLAKVQDLTSSRLEMVEYLNENLSTFECLDIFIPPKSQICTYYQYKFLFDQERAGVKCSEFIKVLNKEGLQFFGGYTPLYKQPLYQQRKLFKHGYPWSAPENKSLCATYNDGSCPVAENLMTCTITSEHIRPPNTMEDMKDIVSIFHKVIG